MKKIFLISVFGLSIFLSACSQPLPADPQEKNNKISELEQQINQMEERNQELMNEIAALENQSQKNIDLERQLAELKNKNEELKKQLEQAENTEKEIDVPQTNISYQEIIEYVNDNITTIINDSSFSEKPANGNWFADGYGFTSFDHFYVDFEDGHFLYRALIKCDIVQNNIGSCKTGALFENQKQWIVVQGEDTQINNPIVYVWARDYEWKR